MTRAQAEWVVRAVGRRPELLRDPDGQQMFEEALVVLYRDKRVAAGLELRRR